MWAGARCGAAGSVARDTRTATPHTHTSPPLLWRPDTRRVARAGRPYARGPPEACSALSSREGRVRGHSHRRTSWLEQESDRAGRSKGESPIVCVVTPNIVLTNVSVPKPNLTLYKNCCTFLAVKFFNSLPDSIKKMYRKIQFLKVVMSHVLYHSDIESLFNTLC